MTDHTSSPGPGPDTYRCPACSIDHPLAPVLGRLVATATRDMHRMSSNLRSLGFDRLADDLDALVVSDEFRDAVRDAFLEFNATTSTTLDDAVDTLLAEVLGYLSDDPTP